MKKPGKEFLRHTELYGTDLKGRSSEKKCAKRDERFETSFRDLKKKILSNKRL
jgi:hypothetical protein